MATSYPEMEYQLKKAPVIGIISSCGGGDWPPLLSVVRAMKDLGHQVFMIFDQGTQTAIEEAGLRGLMLPPHMELSTIFTPVLQNIITRDKEITPDLCNPLETWGKSVLRYLQEEGCLPASSLVLASLLCIDLGRQLSDWLKVPWCFINPGFFFGHKTIGPNPKDFSSHGAKMYEHWLLPAASSADMVLHATDPVFDKGGTLLPENHFYTGPLFWERQSPLPDFMNDPGPPWVLLSLSTAPQINDMEIISTALEAFKAMVHNPVRLLATLPGRDSQVLKELSARFQSRNRGVSRLYITDYLPHSNVLKKCWFALSHAGHGSVIKSLYHGTPMILVPWGRDQPGNASRAGSLGAALVIDRKHYGMNAIDKAVKQIVTDQKIKSAALRTSERLISQDGPARACALIETLI